MLRFVLMGTSLATLAACVGGQGFDGDFRRYGKGGFSTSDAALNVTTNRPQPDARRAGDPRERPALGRDPRQHRHPGDLRAGAVSPAAPEHV